MILPNKYKKLDTNQIIKILIEKLYIKVAENEIERAMEKTRLLLGFAPEDFSIETLKTNVLATFSTDEKKFTIGTEIAKFDRNIIDYIVLHEFCHLKYKNHTKSFYNMLKTYMPNYEEKAKELNGIAY